MTYFVTDDVLGGISVLEKKLFSVLCLALWGLLSLPSFVCAQQTPYLKDFITVDVPDPGGLDVSADYLMMNDAIDLFDFREGEVDSSTLNASPALGDLKGGRLLVNLGILPSTGLHAGYTRSEIAAGPFDFTIDTWELYLRRQLWSQSPRSFVGASVDFGGRIDRARDRHITDLSQVNQLIRRLGPEFSEVSVSKVNDRGIDFVSIDSGDGVALLTPQAGLPDFEVSLTDVEDYSFFGRVILGRFFDGGGAHLFFEAGRSVIDTTIDSNIALFLPDEQFLPDSVNQGLAELPMDLDRDETYYKVGGNLQLQLPFGLLGNLKYEYLRLDRDKDLSFIDYNHIVTGDLIWPLGEHVALDLGATYLRRQFNGVIPFMYNTLSQTTFDHDYGFVNLGVVARFY